MGHLDEQTMQTVNSAIAVSFGINAVATGENTAQG
jgi:hypothetical protein